jgi:membrane-associated protease RseP (regulator of RpoE activity)
MQSHSIGFEPGVPPDSTAPAATRPARNRLQALLLLLTGLTTFAAGVSGWQADILGFDDQFGLQVAEHWRRGLLYMVAVLAVLGAHEAGHFIAAWLHRIPATLPFFIPVPILLTGTMGAVIGMEGSRANRRQLFDIALAGPLAGLVVAIPILAVGMVTGEAATHSPFALPPLARGILGLVRPDISAAGTIAPNALFMAGWVGLLVTGLNMIPISQLDGGHVSYAIFGRRAHWIARSVLIAAIAAIVILGRTNWVAMVVMVTLLGTDHPPIRDDGRPLGLARTVLGMLSFLIPIVTFMPEPLLLD